MLLARGAVAAHLLHQRREPAAARRPAQRLAIRASPASRSRLVGQIVAETAAWRRGRGWNGRRVIARRRPGAAELPGLAAVGPDARVLMFRPVALPPRSRGPGSGLAGHAFRFERGRARVRSRGATSGEREPRHARRRRRWLALVATAGLMAKSLVRLQGQDLGWTREPVLTFGVGLPPFVAPDDAAIARMQTAFLSRLRALPGVTAASAISGLPIAVTGMNGPVKRADQADERGVPVTEFRAVMDGYFETMGVHLLAGRAITDRTGRMRRRSRSSTRYARLFPARIPGAVGRLCGSAGRAAPRARLSASPPARGHASRRPA